MNNIYEILQFLWATNSHSIRRQFEQQTESDCEGVWAVYKLSERSDGSGSQSSVLGGRFLWGDGRCDYKKR